MFLKKNPLCLMFVKALILQRQVIDWFFLIQPRRINLLQIFFFVFAGKVGAGEGKQKKINKLKKKNVLINNIRTDKMIPI